MLGHVDPEILAGSRAFSIGQGEALIRINAEDKEVEVEKCLVAIPAGEMIVAGDDTPRAVRLDELSIQAERFEFY